jgi:hypothetical protein
MNRFAFAAAGIALVIAAPSAQPPQCDTGCFPAHYWKVDTNDYEKTDVPSFPEQPYVADRSDFGLAFSGGGTRSASATLGALRGLQKNGWLSRVRYISAVSGGSWAAVPFVYSVLPLDALLGTMEDRSTKPETFLKTPNGALAVAIAKSSFFATGTLETAAITATLRRDDIESRSMKARFALEAFFQLTNRLRRDPDRINKTYTRLIGKAFIDPLLSPGTTTSDAYFSWNGQSLSSIERESLAQLEYPSLSHGDRPYLIASGTLVQNTAPADGDADAVFPTLAPVEYTPIYVGVRQTFDVKVKGQDDKDTTVHLGGGYVESWAYDTEEVGPAEPVEPAKPGAESAQPPADAVKVPWNGSQKVKIDRKRRFSLADVAASSGAAPQLLTITGGPVPDDYKGYVRQAAQVFPAFRHLSIARNTLTSDEVPHADGGAQDNLGVMPLFARQVKNVLVFINTSTKEWRYNDDLRSLFVTVGPPDSGGDKRDNAVLQAADSTKNAYDEVLAAFDQARADQAPIVYCGKNWTVRKNAHYNIRGYGGLNICFFYNAQPAGWAASLPDAVQPDVAKEKNFPWFETFEQDRPHVIQLKASEINLLANMWAWITTNEGVVKLVRRTLDNGVLP